MKKYDFSREISKKFQLHKYITIFPGKFRFFQAISQNNFDFPCKNWPFTATSGQIILFLFKSHHFRTYFLYMIIFNNISRPLAQNLGVVTPNPPGLTPLAGVNSRNVFGILFSNVVRHRLYVETFSFDSCLYVGRLFRSRKSSLLISFAISSAVLTTSAELVSIVTMAKHSFSWCYYGNCLILCYHGEALADVTEITITVLCCVTMVKHSLGWCYYDNCPVPLC